MDIPKIRDFDRYRFVIFTSAFRITPEKKKILENYVLRGGKTVLWLYAPGIWTGDSFGTENCEKLTGIPYEAEGLVQKDMGGWKSCYLHSFDALTVSMLRELSENAGVRMTVDEPLPVYAEGNLLSVHTATGGEMTVCTDEKYKFAEELFTGNTVRIENGKFNYAFREPDTALFLLKE